jgi:hypothetical protein
MTAFRAIYADWKLIKTRSVVQVVLELPVEQADAAYEVLGGMPVAAKERWFGVAAIRNPEASPGASVTQPGPVTQPRPDRVKRDWRDLPPSQQAGIRCEEPAFLTFLADERPDDLREVEDAADCVRMICGVVSRSELNTNQKARVIWHQLNDQYEAWLKVGA